VLREFGVKKGYNTAVLFHGPVVKDIERSQEYRRWNTDWVKLRMVIVNAQSEMVEMAANYNENVNNDSVGLKYILIKGEEWIEIDKITTKDSLC
jgi:hypothetical protein